MREENSCETIYRCVYIKHFYENVRCVYRITTCVFVSASISVNHFYSRLSHFGFFFVYMCVCLSLTFCLLFDRFILKWYSFLQNLIWFHSQNVSLYESFVIHIRIINWPCRDQYAIMYQKTSFSISTWRLKEFFPIVNRYVLRVVHNKFNNV